MIIMAVTTALHYIVCVYVLSVAILAQTFGWLHGKALDAFSTSSSLLRCASSRSDADDVVLH